MPGVCSAYSTTSRHRAAFASLSARSLPSRLTFINETCPGSGSFCLGASIGVDVDIKCIAFFEVSNFGDGCSVNYFMACLRPGRCVRWHANFLLEPN